MAILLHWVIAGLLLLNLYQGFRMGQLKGLERFELMQLHKSIGLTVLALTLLRVLWRWFNRPPQHPKDMPAWQKAAAGAIHAALYLIMLGLPLVGWIIVSASPMNLPTLLYGTVPWPHLAPVHDLPMDVRRSVAAGAGTAHEFLAWSAIALVALHVAGALKHQFWDRDGGLYRMAPFLSPPSEGKDAAHGPS